MDQILSNLLTHLYSGLPYLGAALATIVSGPDAKANANKSFSAIEIKPTGQELIDLFTEIHGASTEVSDYTAADREQLLASGNPFAPVTAGYLKNWEEDSWKVGEDIKVTVRERQTLEEIAKPFI